MQQADWSLTYPYPPTPHLSSPPCNAAGGGLSTTAISANPTSRTWSNPTPQPVHHAPRLPNYLLFNHYWAAVAQEVEWLTRRLQVWSLAPPDWGSRCPWAKQGNVGKNWKGLWVATDIRTAESLLIFLKWKKYFKNCSCCLFRVVLFPPWVPLCVTSNAACLEQVSSVREAYADRNPDHAEGQNGKGLGQRLSPCSSTEAHCCSTAEPLSPNPMESGSLKGTAQCCYIY